MRGKDLLIVGALVWATVPMLWLGLILKKLRFTRMLGVALYWQAFVLYGLSWVCFAMVMADAVNHAGWESYIVFLALPFGVPLAVCTAHFYRDFRQWLVLRRAPRPSGSAA